MTRRRMRLEKKERESERRVRRVVSARESPNVQLGAPTQLPSALQRRVLPGHSSAAALSQSAVLDMQRRYGNAAVQRYLASQGSRADAAAIQRQLKPEKTKGEAAVGRDELKFKAELNLSSEGDLSLELGPAVNLKNFGLAATGSYDVTKGWKAVGQLRLGDKKNYLAPRVTITPDGKATLELGAGLSKDVFSLSSSFATGKDKTTLGATLGWRNPFGAERFDVKASMLSRLDVPQFSSAKMEANYKILGDEVEKSSPFLMLTFEGSYTAPGPKPGRGEAKALLLLRGNF
jgi:hypothetical protein